MRLNGAPATREALVRSDCGQGFVVSQGRGQLPYAAGDMDGDLTGLSRGQEQRLRLRLHLTDEPVRTVTSGWHKIVVLADERAFAFPRNGDRVAMLQREADVLSTLELPLAPRFLGLHRDERIWPYPFLEMTRLPGRSWDTVDTVDAALSFEEVARCLEALARLVASWHQIAVPPLLADRPDHVGGGLNDSASGHPRLNDRWTGAGGASAMTHQAAEILSGHMKTTEPDLWTDALGPVLSMDQVTVHGELSDGQFLLDEELGITGIVDWDGLHRGHPLLDLDSGVGLYRIHYERHRYTELRHRMWDAYEQERSVALPTWPQVNLLWCLLDAMALAQHQDHELWLPVLAELTRVSDELRHLGRLGP